MKTIEEAAYENASIRNDEKEIQHLIVRQSFTKGAEFVQRWIPVDE